MKIKDQLPVLERLNTIADSLVSVAGTLMMVALTNGRSATEPEIHEEGCDCNICRAFLSTQAAITNLSEIIEQIEE